MRPAIIWTIDGIVYWRIYASLGLDELINPLSLTIISSSPVNI